jgi:hypothetical protein
VKKVRLAAAGAVGMVPAVGLMMMPSAAGAAAFSQKPAKTVSLQYSKVPDAGCAGHDAIHAHTQNFYISVWHTPSTHCVGGVSASMRHFCNTGFVLRTRAYSASQYGTKTEYINTTVGGHMRSCGVLNSTVGSTSFYQGIHQVRPTKEQVCEAIVFASNHNKVYRGPVCVSF